MTNQELANRFAGGHDSGHTGHMRIVRVGHATVIYSYGVHWPIATLEGNRAYLNTDKYSRTTSIHTSKVCRALHNNGRVVTEHNLRHLNDHISMIRARSEWRARQEF